MVRSNNSWHNPSQLKKKTRLVTRQGWHNVVSRALPYRRSRCADSEATRSTLRAYRPGNRANQPREAGAARAQYACARHMCVGAVHVLLVDGLAWALVPRIEAGSRACFASLVTMASLAPLPVAATFGLPSGVIPRAIAESELS
jgi:hypothetical protein